MSKVGKLNDSINIPVNRAFKRRVVDRAEQLKPRIAPTAFARMLLEDGLNRFEKVREPLAAK